MKGGRGGERKRGMGVGWGREGSAEEEILLSFTQPPSLSRLSSGVRYNKVGGAPDPILPLYLPPESLDGN